MSLRSLALTLLVGTLLGIVSRLIDTASWAPDWFGNVFTPWLAAAWLAGTTAPAPRNGAARGLSLLLATVGSYLVLAAVSGDALTLAPRLVPLALVAGPIFGVAGATWRGGGPWAVPGGALLGGAIVAEGLALQLGVGSPLEHYVLAGESLVGIGLTVRLSRTRRPA
jgi:hypothetical protein